MFRSMMQENLNGLYKLLAKPGDDRLGCQSQAFAAVKAEAISLGYSPNDAVNAALTAMHSASHI